jgi:hypothetical protein
MHCTRIERGLGREVESKRRIDYFDHQVQVIRTRIFL